jgi:hypothetical protein
MYLPYSMLSVLYEQHLADAGCATRRGARAPAGDSRLRLARRTRRGLVIRLAGRRASRVQPAKPRPALLP